MHNHIYRAPWSVTLSHLHQSLYAEQMVCALSSQLFHIPQTQNLRGNLEMHKHLEEASYHRLTATGSAQRLVNGEYHESIVKTLVSCVRTSKLEDQGVNKWLVVMQEAATIEYKPFVQNIIVWQERAERELEAAQQELRRMGIMITDQVQGAEY